MPRKKAAQNCSIKFWMSERMDNREPAFLQVGVSLLRSKPFLDLSPGARSLYLAMAAEAGKSEVFEFPWGKAVEYGLVSKNSFERWKAELISGGFILTMERNQNLRKPNLYRFSLGWKRNANGINDPKEQKC